MASNKEKLIAAAEKLVEKGQYDKAIKEYLKVVAEEPDNVRVWLKIGDLHAKLNRTREAAETYQRVAAYYSDKGHYLKAVAVYKQILKIEPRMVDVNQRLAEMYKQLGLISDAMQQYEAVAAHFHKEGRPRDALAALKQIAELDTDNVAARIKLAEMYSKESMVREAIDEFSRAAEYLHERGRIDDYMKVAERLLFHAPDNRPVSRELARLYVEKGDPRRALPKLQVVLKADARDVEALGLLARAFEALGQAQKSVSVLKELARIHQENGARTEHDATLRRVLTIAPDDPEAQQALGALKPPQPEMPAIVDEPPEPAPTVEARPPQRTVEMAPAAVLTPGPTFLEEAGQDATVSEAASDEEIGKILTETDVYIKYGLHAKALEHVQKVFLRVPDHVEAREKVASLYVATQRIDEAVAELFHLAKQTAGTPRAEEYLRQILELQPGNQRARTMLAQGVPMPTPGPIRLAPVPLRTVIDEGPADEPAEEEVLTLDESALVEEEDPYAAEIEAALAADRAVDETPMPLVLDSDPELTPDESDPPLPSLTAEPAALPSLARETVDDATAGARPAVMRAMAQAAGDAPYTAEHELPTRERGDARPEGGSLEDDLDEADFFIQQNMFDEAREILNGLLGRYPNHPLVTAKLNDMEAVARGEPSPAEPLPEHFGEEPQPLPPLSSAVAPPDSTSVNDVGGERRRNVVEKGVTPEDFETHYDLGIAYKEMGLIDDAMAEFNLVMQDPAREVQCHMMLGLCYAEKGLMTDAIAQFKEGLYAENIQEREQLAIYYELGQAYERLSDGREALYYYEKVMKRDAHFRDVNRRVQALRGGAGGNGNHGALPAEGDVDAAFDGLLSGDEERINEARGSK